MLNNKKCNSKGKHLVLHIGMHKTGSSSLQRMFLLNHRWFNKNKIFYPLAYENHSSLVVPAYKVKLDDYPHAVALACSRSQQKLNILKNSCNKILSDVFSLPWEGTVVLSGEDISSALTNEEKYLLLCDVSKYYDKISIIAFVRPPASWIKSTIVQEMRNRCTYDELIGSAILKQRVMPRYQDRFSAFVGYHAENVRTHLYLFDTDLMSKNYFVSHFLRHLDILLDDLPFQVPHLNASMSPPGQHYINFLNQCLPSIDHHLPHPGWRTDAVSIADRMQSNLDVAPLIKDCDVDRIKNNITEDTEWMSSVLGVDLHNLD
jgi:hypothetical protein